MNAVRPPTFDGGPAFPCDLDEQKCGVSVRTYLFGQVLAGSGGAGFARTPSGDYIAPAHFITQAMACTDAAMDALDIHP
jgi:hypothetical protein